MATPIKWEDANFHWNDNSYSWDEVQLVEEVVQQIQQGAIPEDVFSEQYKKRKKLIKLILKIKGETLTESIEKEIKQYKIQAKDIKLVVKEVLGVEMIAENISI